MSTPNVDLLNRTLAHIEQNTDVWEQRTYRCRTGMCFAGWAAQLNGGTWYSNDPDDGYGDDMIAVPEDDDGDVFLHKTGVRLIDVARRAVRILGLTGDQGAELFDGDNTLHDLRRIVTSICEGAGR